MEHILEEGVLVEENDEVIEDTVPTRYFKCWNERKSTTFQFWTLVSGYVKQYFRFNKEYYLLD